MGRGEGKAADHFTSIMGNRRGIRPGQISSLQGYVPTDEQLKYVQEKLAQGKLELPLVATLGEILRETVVLLKANKPGEYFYVHPNGSAFEVGLGDGEDSPFPDGRDIELANALVPAA